MPNQVGGATKTSWKSNQEKQYQNESKEQPKWAIPIRVGGSTKMMNTKTSRRSNQYAQYQNEEQYQNAAVRTNFERINHFYTSASAWDLSWLFLQRSFSFKYAVGQYITGHTQHVITLLPSGSRLSVVLRVGSTRKSQLIRKNPQKEERLIPFLVFFHSS